MTNNSWWMLAALALGVGLVAGGWAALRIARTRHAAKLRRSLEEMQHKFAATIDQMRAAQVRAQTDLEQARNSFNRQLTAAAAEPRAATARAEEKLRAAYDELDRIRRGNKPLDEKRSDLSDGFAATRPMREGL